MSRDSLTGLLSLAASGDSGAARRALALVYEELRSIAGKRMKHLPPGQTIQPTALAHEVFIKLLDGERSNWRNKALFYTSLAQTARDIIVTHARRRGAQKRGGGRRRQALGEEEVGAPGCISVGDLLDLDEALTLLERQNERQAQVVKLRFFGGLTVEETASALGISPRSVNLEWALARAWLERRLTGKKALASVKD